MDVPPLDSRISPRELSAVEEWQSSGRTYHIMRDNPHHVATIVGCCFGMKITKQNYANMTTNFDKMLDYVGNKIIPRQGGKASMFLTPPPL